jgi:hypothetical protein
MKGSTSHVFLTSHLFVFNKYLQVGTSRAALAENFCCSALAHVCCHGLGLSFSGETSFAWHSWRKTTGWGMLGLLGHHVPDSVG